jgi:hypothetical protein
VPPSTVTTAGERRESRSEMAGCNLAQSKHAPATSPSPSGLGDREEEEEEEEEGGRWSVR